MNQILKNERFWWILGLLISALVSLYFFIISVKEREPTFIVEPIKTQIVDSKNIIGSPIQVIIGDSIGVNENITVVRFYFWNAGKEPIMGTDALSEILISTTGKAKIIHSKILKTSREVCELSINQMDSTHLKVKFRILEKNDGFTGEIFVLGDSKTDLAIEGEVVGVKDFSKDILSIKILKAPTFLLLIFIVVAGIITIVRFNSVVPEVDSYSIPYKDKKIYSTDPEFKTIVDELEKVANPYFDQIIAVRKYYRSKTKDTGISIKTAKNIFVGLMIIITGFVAWTHFRNSIESVKKNPSEYIPESIRPL